MIIFFILSVFSGIFTIILYNIFLKGKNMRLSLILSHTLFFLSTCMGGVWFSLIIFIFLCIYLRWVKLVSKNNKRWKHIFFIITKTLVIFICILSIAYMPIMHLRYPKPIYILYDLLPLFGVTCLSIVFTYKRSRHRFKYSALK